MVSVLPSSARADLFLLSYHLHCLPPCVSKLASVWFGIPGSEKSPGIASRDYQCVLIILTSLPAPPSQILPVGCGDLEPCPEKKSLWPLSSCEACQVLQIFPVDVSMPVVGLGDVGVAEERVEMQAVGLWDHFTLTYIHSFCSEWLNMKTTQLLLTPALPPEHSNSN